MGAARKVNEPHTQGATLESRHERNCKFFCLETQVLVAEAGNVSRVQNVIRHTELKPLGCISAIWGLRRILSLRVT